MTSKRSAALDLINNSHKKSHLQVNPVILLIKCYTCIVKMIQQREPLF